VKGFFGAIAARLVAWGPWGAFVLAVVDSAGVPVPVGVDALVLTVAAWNVTAGYFGATLAVIGSLIGSLFLFYLGRKGGEAYLDQRTQRGWPKRFRRWFHHYGGLTIFIPVLVPVPLPVKVFVLSAGALGMRRSRFVLLMAVARTIRYFGLAYVGTQMGPERPMLYIRSHVWEMIAGTVLLFLVSYALVKRADYLRAKLEHHQHRAARHDPPR
jgi:membrane protein YqaA with SNARE-associated domain